MTRTRAVFASPAARRALGNGRPGVTQIVLPGGAYLTLGEDWLLVSRPSLARENPLGLGVQGAAQLTFSPGARVAVCTGQLIVGDLVFSLERMRERRLPVVRSGPVAGPWAVARAVRAVLAELPPLSARPRAGVDALFAGALGEAARLLAGVGEGLTPAGDDVLAGYAGWVAACAENRRADESSGEGAVPLSELAGGRCSPLGRAYLRCAEVAELPGPAVRLLTALRGGSLTATRAALPGLREWGASSGIALGWGMVAAAARVQSKPQPLNTIGTT